MENKKSKDLEEIEKLLHRAKYSLKGYYTLKDCAEEAEDVKEEILSYSCHTEKHISEIDDIIEEFDRLLDAESTYYQLEEDGVFDDWD